MLEFQLDTRKFIAALITVAALCIGLPLVANRYIQVQVLQASLVSMVLFGVTAVILVLFWRYSKSSTVAIKTRAIFEAIIEGSNDAIVSTDIDGHITSWNLAASKIFGNCESDIRGNNIFAEIFPADTHDYVKQHFDRTLAGERLPYFSANVIGLDGRSIHIAVTFSPVRLENKNVAGVAAIIRDISDAKNVEQQLHKANEQLVAKNREMEQFIYTVSHDLKSPLITINSFARSVAGSEDNQLSEQSEHRLNRIIANIEHMDKLLGELLNLSRILKQDIVIETCDIKDCVREVKEAIEEIVESKNGVIKVDIKSDHVRANRRLLVQCLHNLFTNAMYYSRDKEPPIVRVSCTNKGKETWVSIQDNGVGIEKRHFEKIFRIFERLGIGAGSGVGLAIVKTAMEKHGGRIELTSEPGQGSIFSLVFPNNASSSKPQA